MSERLASLPQGPNGLDPDGTHQLPAADRTITDLPAGFANDGTQEIDGEDILEVKRVATELEEPRLLGPLPPPVSPPRPSHPSSIAPIAIDVAPASRPMRDVPDSTLQIQQAAGIPTRSSRKLVVGGAIVASTVLVALISMGVVRHNMNAEKAKTAAVEIAAARAPEISRVEEAIPEVEPLAPAKVEPVRVADTTDASVVTLSPVTVAPKAPITNVVSATPPLSTAKKSKSKGNASQTGVLRVPASVGALLVDGRPKKVSGGSLSLTCGNHRIKLPSQPGRVVNVPCGKAVSL